MSADWELTVVDATTTQLLNKQNNSKQQQQNKRKSIDIQTEPRSQTPEQLLTINKGNIRAYTVLMPCHNDDKNI